MSVFPPGLFFDADGAPRGLFHQERAIDVLYTTEDSYAALLPAELCERVVQMCAPPPPPPAPVRKELCYCGQLHYARTRHYCYLCSARVWSFNRLNVVCNGCSYMFVVCNRCFMHHEYWSVMCIPCSLDAAPPDE